MKRLYKTVLVNEPPELGEAEPPRRTATPEAIHAAEIRLGITLPKTFKDFAAQVGAAYWPVQIHAVEALAPYPADWERPAFLIAFATDGGGNDWCFDTRKLGRGEYAIVFWDHEEPPGADELEEQGAPTAFDAWLSDLVLEQFADNESAARDAQQERIEAALAPHRETNTWPWAPSEDDVAAVAAQARIPLPRDYVWFTTTLGSTRWPLHIPDVLEIERLTAEMRQRFPKAKAAMVAFGKEDDGTFVAFPKFGRPVAVGGRPIRDKSFSDFIERRIKERLPAEAGDDVARGESGMSDEPSRVSSAATGNDIPSRIADDERVNSVWRAVAKAKKLTATAGEDGRIQVEVQDFKGGRRRMFVEAEAWETVKRQLEKRDR